MKIRCNRTDWTDKEIIAAYTAARAKGAQPHIDTRDCDNADNYRGYQYVMDVRLGRHNRRHRLTWYPTEAGYAAAQADGDESLMCDWDMIDVAAPNHPSPRLAERVDLRDGCTIIRSLKDWLDANTYVDSDPGLSYWYYGEDGKPVIRDDNNPAWIAICDANDIGYAIYTDNMSYEWHGWQYGDGSGKVDILLDRLPPDVLDDVEADPCDDLPEQMQAYLRHVNGWDFDTDYFESSHKELGDGNLSDKDIIRLLDLPHDINKDEINPDEDED